LLDGLGVGDQDPGDLLVLSQVGRGFLVVAQALQLVDVARDDEAQLLDGMRSGGAGRRRSRHFEAVQIERAVCREKLTSRPVPNSGAWPKLHRTP
jgi:hypothetical protein